MSDLNSRSVIRTLQRAGFRVLRNRDHVRLSDGAVTVSYTTMQAIADEIERMRE